MECLLALNALLAVWPKKSGQKGVRQASHGNGPLADWCHEFPMPFDPHSDQVIPVSRRELLSVRERLSGEGHQPECMCAEDSFVTLWMAIATPMGLSRRGN